MNPPPAQHPYSIHPFAGTDWCPNNHQRPLVVYQFVHQADPEALAAWFERTFAQHGWPPAWRYTIFDFPHYHSNTHEVIGVYRGTATVQLGDTAGQPFDLKPGDTIIIPAGVSHQRLSSSDDFSAVGAYPEGFDPDQIRKDRPDQKESADAHSVPTPDQDPLGGPALTAEWPH